MIIERSSRDSILPEAVETLVSCQSVKTYHDEYGYRPPLGTYNVALSKVIKRLVNVLDELDIMMNEQPFRHKESYGTHFDYALLAEYENLLKSISEYFDACMNTLKCFYPALIGKKNKQFWKIPEVDLYWQSVNDTFFSHVQTIVNVVKHENRQLKFYVMFTDDYAIPGYFVESIDENGRILPDRNIHIPVRSKYDPDSGYDTAFSFFRDLRFLFWGIYYVSHHLAIAIRSITHVSTTSFSAKGKNDEAICSVAERIAALPLRFYSDELKKDLPSVKLNYINDEIQLRLVYPDTSQILIAGHGKLMNLTLIVSDGVTTTYKFPYSTGGEL